MTDTMANPIVQEINRTLAAIQGAADLAKKLDAFRQVFEKFDRIMADVPVRVVITANPAVNAPAWTDGETIWVNAVYLGLLTGKPLEAIVMAAKALNLHELCHVLYTPRQSSDLTKWVLSQMNDGTHSWSQYVKQAWNILEDQRIETMFVAMYQPAAMYFEANVMTWMLERQPDEIGGFFPIIWGRKFLPKRTIEAVEEAWVRDQGWAVTKKFRSVISRYLKVVFPTDTPEAIRLITQFAKLLEQVAPKLPEMGEMVVTEHPDDVLDKGQPSRQAQEAAQKRIANVKRRPTKVQDGQGKDGEGEGQADGDEDEDELEGAGEGAGEPQDGDEGDEGQGQAGAGQDDAEDAPEDAGEPDSGEGAGVGGGKALETMEELQGILDDLIHDGTFAAELDKTVNAIAEAMAEVELSPMGEKLPGSVEMVPQDARNASEQMVTTLQALRVQMEETFHRRMVQGMLDGRRFMSRQPWDVDFFKLWQPGEMEHSDIEAVLVIDQSWSMGHATLNTAKALWATKYALEALNARVTVLGFADSAYVLYGPEDKAASHEMRVFYTHGGTMPKTALAQAHRILHASNRSIKLLLTVTDGDWQGDVDTSERYVQSMTNEGVITALSYIGNLQPGDPWAERHRHEHTIFKAVNDVGELVPLALMIVEHAMARLVNNMLPDY